MQIQVHLTVQSARQYEKVVFFYLKRTRTRICAPIFFKLHLTLQYILVSSHAQNQRLTKMQIMLEHWRLIRFVPPPLPSAFSQLFFRPIADWSSYAFPYLNDTI